jgi:hypothetical protein
LITKEVATISGVAFTLVFFLMFLISERINKRKEGTAAHVEMEQFQTHAQENVSYETAFAVTIPIAPGTTQRGREGLS